MWLPSGREAQNLPSQLSSPFAAVSIDLNFRQSVRQVCTSSACWVIVFGSNHRSCSLKPDRGVVSPASTLRLVASPSPTIIHYQAPANSYMMCRGGLQIREHGRVCAIRVSRVQNPPAFAATALLQRERAVPWARDCGPCCP